MTALSSRQQIMMDFIHRFIEDNGYPPAIRDIVSGCKISSTSVVAYNLNILKEKGYIRRQRDVSRGIELKNSPAIHKWRAQVPLVGQIAAGEPIPAPIPDAWDTTSSSETIEVPSNLTQGKEGIYALKVKGASMVDALIGDGDIVLMQQANIVENGQMAAIWLKEEREVTLKKFYAEPRRVRLQPANSQMKPIFAKPDNIEIQGKVIAVIRQVAI